MNLPSGSFQSGSVLPFIYADDVTLAASIGTQATGSFTMDTDSWFELWYFVASSSLDADDDVIPNNFTIQISQQASGRALSNVTIPARMITSPQNPFMRQMRPVVFAPTTTIQFVATNTVASANVVTFGFAGYKLYKS